MNHGYCTNCWWYKVMEAKHIVFIPNYGLKENWGHGRCYMHNSGEKDEYGNDYTNVVGRDYCPDYCNRNRENRKSKMTLEEWIKKID